ncbi:6121_t:CDS:2 [Cetraspora pellucida]|uniref:6121_t:CDS:1 n=1 Tax=Cetraspora pellucida TaxID=1433469 RepID=A0A9N8YW95_9GLOM|nr:6121_t:CDS:2 [Cetraspora pellucida]
MSSSSLNEAAVEEEELYSSWALLIQIVLLILALWTSYYLQIKQIRSIHETVISIFAGMVVGLIIRLSPGYIIQKLVSFKYSYFFNLLLPPIILNSGYEMKKIFHKSGGYPILCTSSILTAILAWTGIDSLSLTLLDSMIFGSVLSATDPVTVLTIFQTLKVDPQLYAIIFGESILNDATSIVLYETLRQYRGQDFHLTNISHGLRGAVAFALAAGLKGDNANAMKATILVVVVLSVIVFGGTTSRMLEVLKIETGVDEGEIDSDDEGYNEYNNYNHVLTNSQGSVVSSGTGGSTEPNIPSRNIPTNINNVSTHAHWFISFDDKYLKPLFTRQHNQDIKPEDRWQKENNNNDEIVGLSSDHTITRV